jgi:hypothetical protein
MTALRLYLAAAWTALLAYTAYVLGNAGVEGALAQFFGLIGEGGWPGLVNLDFTTFLIAAALWTGWRNGWTALGWVLAYAVFSLGGLVLWGYVLVLLHREKGDLKRVLLGVRADDAPHRRWTD